MNTLKMRATFLVLVGLVLLTGSLAFGQSGGLAGVSGTVTDTSGATIPDVKIVVTNIDTGVSNTVASDSQGRYFLPNIAVGNYKAAAQKVGFQELLQTGIALSVGRNTIVDFVLHVGQVTQQVQVAAEASVVETQDVSLGLLVGAQEVKDLPLNGRSYVSMAAFSPGVTALPVTLSIGFGEGAPLRFAINGARSEGQLFLMDDTDTKTFWGNSTGATLAGTTLGIEAISEFQVLTNTYSVQYGGNGSVVNAAIRSGTNAFHGTLFEFARNSAMDTRNFFDPPTGPPEFYRHQFGVAFGGPIRKNKVFFFTNYEGLRQNLGSTSTSFVPDANARNGFLPCTAAPGVPCDAATGLANVGAVNPAGFALIQPVLNTFPLPTGPSLGGGVASNVQALFSPTSENYGVAKLDYNISATDSISLDYIYDGATLLQPNPVPTQGINNIQSTHQVTFEEKKIVSPSKINTVHVSFFRPSVVSAPGNTPSLDILPGHLGGSFSVPGWTGLGGGGILEDHNNNLVFLDDFYWVRGKHTIQFGGEVSRHQVNLNNPLEFQGGYVFLGAADFLEDNASTFTGPLPGDENALRGVRHTNLAGYFQDKYLITPRLTVTLGARYDWESDPTEAHNLFTTIVNPLTSTGFSPVSHAFYSNPTNRNIGPRVGVAWDPFGNGKTSVRAGFGLFYDLPSEAQVAIATTTNPPYVLGTVSDPPYPNPLTVGAAAPARPSLGQGTLYGAPGTYPNHGPYIMQFNLNVQRQLSAGTLLTVGYVGTQARHLYLKDDENTCLPTSILPNGFFVRNYPTAAALANCPVTNPNFSSLDIAIPRGTSNYNALQVSLDHRFNNGLEFQVAYTYSRCLSFGDNYTAADSFNIGSSGGSAGGQYPGLDVSSRGNQDFGPCDFNLSHNFSSNLLYALPFQGSRWKAGWQVGLIPTAHAGFLTTPIVGLDTANCGFNACAGVERPDVVPGCNPLAGAKTATEWFNPLCFTEPAPGVFGDARRNTIKGPGYVDFDASLVKNTKITESTHIELRAEIFNLANHPNLGFPNFSLFTGTGRDPSAGEITNTAGYTSRQLQFAAKFIF